MNACKKSDHRTPDGFTNPYSEPFNKGPLTFVWMKYFGNEPFSVQEKDADKVPIATPQWLQINQPSEQPLATWLGQSTFLLQKDGINILTDPILSQRASPSSFFGPKRLVAMPIKLEDLPHIDYVVISHNHYDHLDRDTVLGLARQEGKAPVFLVPLGLKQWFLNEDFDPVQVIERDWWQQYESTGEKKLHKRHLIFTATPAQHWSGRGLLDRFKSLWASWHIQMGDFSIWFAGDTGYNSIQFAEIGENWGGVDLALIPIGAYAPRWFMKMQHINPEEAIKIHRDVKARLSIGMHWGTFQLTAETIDEPVTRIQKAVKAGQIRSDEFITLAIGETRALGTTAK